MSVSVSIVPRVATIEEYRRICTDVGWQDVMNFDAAPASLAASLFGVVAVEGDVAVGMARIVGDGAIYFYVQDVAVVRSHQGQGVGLALVTALDEWLTANAPDGAFVGLFAAPGSTRLYERFGFARHEGLAGMFRVVGVG